MPSRILFLPSRLLNISKMSETSAPATEEQPSVPKIRALLGAKDDTSRFVGLALLKSVLDNTPEVRDNEEVIVALWESIPPKFMDRLMRTGSRQTPSAAPGTSSPRKDSNDMLDLAVSVLHTFAALLPETARQSPRLLDRIPQLVACLLRCSDETTRLALETLVSLVSQPDGARVFTAVEDLSPLTETAPSQPLALDALLYAWLNAMAVTADKHSLRSKIDSTINSLVSSFKGTDAVTLLSFLSRLLPRLEPEILPPNPKWLPSVSKSIRNLAASRPTAAGREAFTNLSAALLEAYPLQSPHLLFSDQPSTTTTTSTSSPASSYLLINLILIDLRATLPTLLSTLNSPSYPATSHRLTSAFNTLSHFLGYLLRALDAPTTTTTTTLSPDNLLKLRTALSETLSLTTEYLRDRYDAAVAGAMGLHADARTTPSSTSAQPQPAALAWDSANEDRTLTNDPLVLAALRALAVWVREDDNAGLRREAAGLADLMVELYRQADKGRLDFRGAVLVALEGIVEEEKGREAVLAEGVWEMLAGDLVGILERGEKEAEAERGVEVVRVLLAIAEAEEGGTREAWMDLVTRVAAWDVPEGRQPGVVGEFQVAAVQLVTTLLANAAPGMRRRYVHSMSAVLGIAKRLRGEVEGDTGLEEALDDVLETLGALS